MTKISTLLYEKSCVDEASLSFALQIARENILTELRDSGLLEEIRNGTKVDWEEYPISEDGADSYNHLARAIKARLDELIKSNNV